jgi:ribulose bisphosphate carboxylase small subunit
VQKMMHDSDRLSLSKKRDFTEVKELIETSFMHDWAITIEYAVQTEHDGSQWVRWDKTFFAIKDAGPVMENIVACCECNPNCSMKMICEHYNPPYRCVLSLRHKDRAETARDGGGLAYQA